MAMDVVPSLMAFGRDTNAASAKGTEGPTGGTGTKRASVVQAGNCKKKRRHEAGVKLLRQVSYRQETYRAVTSL
jgi:hypothetical protein